MMGFEDYSDKFYDDFLDDGSDEEEVKLKFLTVARETRAAWFITFELKEETLEPVQVWLPKSQCSMGAEEGTIYVPQWLVDSNDLEAYRED